MVVLTGFLTLPVMFIAIISSSHCDGVSNLAQTSVKSYRKFITIEEESSVRNDMILALILDKIIDLYMPGQNLLCIITDNTIENNSTANVFKEFLKLGTKNVIIMIPGAQNFDLRQVIYQKPTIYFLLGIDLSTVLESLINFGKMSGTWNPRGLYISIAESREKAATIMTNLWKKFVYKVVVIVFHNNTFDTVEAYTWRPYYPDNYCGPPIVKNIIKLGEFTKSLQFKKETDTEPGMIPDKFGNCPLNISLNIWEPFVYPPAKDENLSIETNLIKIVCNKIGIKFNPTYHELKVEKDANYEAWAGTYVPLNTDIELYEISIPYIQDALGWVVPCCEEINLFEIADAFPTSLWLPSAMAMSLAALALMVTGNKHWILWVWASLTEQSDYKVANKIRWIWGSWLFLCLHLSVAYKTALVSRLTNPLTEGRIQSQSELLESGLKLGFLPAAELWFNKDDEIEKQILDQYVPCETVIKCYKEIPTGRAVFSNKMFFNYLRGQKHEMGLMTEKMHQLPTSLTYKVTMVYVKGHAVLPSFDKFSLLTIQAGFTEYWIKNIEEIQTRIKMHRLNFTREEELSFSQLYGGFKLLYIGLIVAGFSFLCEIFHHLLRDKGFLDILRKKNNF